VAKGVLVLQSWYRYTDMYWSTHNDNLGSWSYATWIYNYLCIATSAYHH